MDVRIDRAPSPATPVGMCGIVYCGRDVHEARRRYSATRPGSNDWGKPDPRWGVVMSRWNAATQSYEVVEHKGFEGGT